MALKPCLGCGKEVDTLAVSCPGCGRPQPTGPGLYKQIKRGILVGGGILIGLWVLVALFSSSSSTPKSHAEASSPGLASAAAPAAPAEKPLEVAATDLFRDYDENEVAADAKYKGRSLFVSGLIHSIDKSFTNDVIVRLQASNPFMSVMATMADSEAGAAAGLKKRQKITLLCRGATRIIGSPTLDHCLIASR